MRKIQIFAALLLLAAPAYAQLSQPAGPLSGSLSFGQDRSTPVYFSAFVHYNATSEL